MSREEQDRPGDVLPEQGGGPRPAQAVADGDRGLHDSARPEREVREGAVQAGEGLRDPQGLGEVPRRHHRRLPDPGVPEPELADDGRPGTQGARQDARRRGDEDEKAEAHLKAVHQDLLHVVCRGSRLQVTYDDRRASRRRGTERYKKSL